MIKTPLFLSSPYSMVSHNSQEVLYFLFSQMNRTENTMKFQQFADAGFNNHRKIKDV